MGLPQSAETFVAFMEDVWRGDCEPTSDGGMIIHGSPLYDKYHDARYAAKQIGAVRLYSSRINNMHVYHYEMPDGSRVAIGTSGNSIRVVNKHHQFN